MLFFKAETEKKRKTVIHSVQDLISVSASTEAMGRREHVCRRGSMQQPFLSLWKRSCLLILVFFSRFDPLSAKMQFFVKTPKKIKSSTVHRVEKMRNGAKVRRFYPKNTGTKEKTAECAAEQI